MNDTIDASRITKNIYLGSYQNGACAYEGLKMLGIKYNLMIGHREQMPLPFPNDIKYKFIELPDQSTANIEQYFEECIDFIETTLRSDPHANILVNCWAGVSRSATIVIAYLIKNFCLNYLEAFEMVRKARDWINPNKGFRHKLIQWSNQLGRPVDTEKINQYDKTRSLLKKLYDNNISFNEQVLITTSFEEIFGLYHFHTIDIRQELLLRQINK
jgi:hypothetical protein